MLSKVMEQGTRKLPMLDACAVPASVRDIISKCLNSDKRNRYSDAQVLSNHIDEVFEELERGISVQDVKPITSWSVREVCEFVQSIGSAFSNTATAMDQNGIDGQFFLEMLDTNADELTKGIPDGGLGFTSLQLKRVRAKVQGHK